MCALTCARFCVFVSILCVCVYVCTCVVIWLHIYPHWGGLPQHSSKGIILAFSRQTEMLWTIYQSNGGLMIHLHHWEECSQIVRLQLFSMALLLLWPLPVCSEVQWTHGRGSSRDADELTQLGSDGICDKSSWSRRLEISPFTIPWKAIWTHKIITLCI